MNRPCLDCGVLSQGSRCPEHEALHARDRYERRQPEGTYDAAWRRLSKRARSLQPFCLDCGARAPLTTDHLPIAHHARAMGKRITLQMVEVVCAPCNSRRGPAHPGSKRYEEWLREASPVG